MGGFRKKFKRVSQSWWGFKLLAWLNVILELQLKTSLMIPQIPV